jgi:hypothetical protein
MNLLLSTPNNHDFFEFRMTFCNVECLFFDFLECIMTFPEYTMTFLEHLVTFGTYVHLEFQTVE